MVVRQAPVLDGRHEELCPDHLCLPVEPNAGGESKEQPESTELPESKEQPESTELPESPESTELPESKELPESPESKELPESKESDESDSLVTLDEFYPHGRDRKRKASYTHMKRSGTVSLTLEQKMVLFTDRRKDEGIRRYQVVANVATTLFCVGVVNVTWACILWYYEYITPTQFMYCICPGFFFLPMSLLVLSTVPADVFDLDDVLQQHWFHRVMFGVFLGSPACCLTYVIQPHFHITMVLSLLLLLPPRPWSSTALICPPTTALSVYLYCMQLSSCAAMAYFAEKPNDSYLSVLLLQYRIVRDGDVGRYLCTDDPASCDWTFAHFYAPAWAVALVVALVSVLAAVRMWARQHLVSSTVRCYDTAYTTYLGFGALCGCPGVVLLALGEQNGGPLFMIGAVQCLPTLVVMLLGKDVVYGALAYRFERSRAEQDGAFVAELMDQRDVVVGNVWWLHHGQELCQFPRGDPRRNFQEGRVVCSETLHFVVRPVGNGPFSLITHSPESSCERSLNESADEKDKRRNIFNVGKMLRKDEHEWNDVTLPLASGSMSADELLAQARTNLRCIEWEKVTIELLTRTTDKSSPQPDWYALSREVAPGEQIGFFMSHSWYDDAVAKFEALCFLAESHKQQHGKYPTFWIDKVCIDQSNISDGLKVLPVNVMACKKMLVLCGSTYTQRLWCGWELCTLVSFMRMRQAVDRLVIIPITEQGQSSTGLNPLTTFDCRKAHCYDPNEEAVLRKIIQAVGNDVFNARICDLSKQCLASVRKSSTATSTTLRMTHTAERITAIYSRQTSALGLRGGRKNTI